MRERIAVAEKHLSTTSTQKQYVSSKAMRALGLAPRQPTTSTHARHAAYVMCPLTRQLSMQPAALAPKCRHSALQDEQEMGLLRHQVLEGLAQRPAATAEKESRNLCAAACALEAAAMAARAAASAKLPRGCALPGTCAPASEAGAAAGAELPPAPSSGAKKNLKYTSQQISAAMSAPPNTSAVHAHAGICTDTRRHE